MVSFLTNSRVLIGSFSSVMAMILMIFYETIYSNQLILIGISEDYVGKILLNANSMIGYFFMAGSFAYMVGCPLIGYLCNFIPKVYIL